MGSLSYELYLSHMFVVLGAVGLYRALLGKEQAWTFTVYLPLLLLCVGLALVLEKFTSGAARRGTCAEDAAKRELIIQ
jgi:peptidoglycan/LPS O-acetylase OafA/YrhL